jgi:hypothetical protein
MKQLIFTTHYRNFLVKFLAILLIFCQGFGLSHQYLYDLELNDNKIVELNNFEKIPTKNNSEYHHKDCFICHFVENLQLSIADFAFLFSLNLLFLAIFFNKDFSLKILFTTTNKLSRAPPKLV